MSLQMTREEWIRIVRQSGVRPAKSMGQNFLIEPDVVTEIANVAAIRPGDLVVEIGPGLGILTRALLDRGANVIAVELDRDLKAGIERELGHLPSFSLIEKDARFVDLDDVLGNRPYALVANLPYSTGTVILRRFLEMPHPPTTLTVMVQREVAERMVASPPDFSLLSLGVQVFARPELAFFVPPDVFLPPPKVESAVVRLETRSKPLMGDTERKHLFDLATMAFQRKRKTIANGLAQGMNLPKAEVEALLATAGIEPGLRPQAVDLDSWVRLARLKEPA